MLTCSKCGEEKPDDAFHRAARNTGRRGRASWCKLCTCGAARAYKRRVPQQSDTEYQREYLRAHRREAVLTLGGRCVRCGVDDERVLDIDHIDGDGHVERRRLSAYAILKRVIAGLPGYQLLCANCHRIKTFEAGEHCTRGVDKA